MHRETNGEPKDFGHNFPSFVFWWWEFLLQCASFQKSQGEMIIVARQPPYPLFACCTSKVRRQMMRHFSTFRECLKISKRKLMWARAYLFPFLWLIQRVSGHPYLLNSNVNGVRPLVFPKNFPILRLPMIYFYIDLIS